MVQLSVTLGVLFGLFGPVAAQQAGKQKKEVHVPISFATCTKDGGCKSASAGLTMDAQWRWTHDAHPNKWGNCLNELMWDESIVTDGKSAAKNCALEGMDADHYKRTYGVSTIPGGVNLNYLQGESIGSRLYMMEDTSTYKMFKLLNREFTFDVDVSTLECGLNGAVYFVEMDAHGGKNLQGNNKAGAKFGTGYCDAQCPKDLKFVGGKGNVRGWHLTKVGPHGHYGSCCSEMDIWEANKHATAFTTHACDTKGPLRCKEADVCGDTPATCKCCAEEDCPCCGRYKGVCDKDGCDCNTFRLGNETYGYGPSYTLDSSKPLTLVTQFITSDGTDTGDLVSIRRLYVQNGREIKNAESVNLKGFKGDSLTDDLCVAQKETFDNRDDFTRKGGLQGMGESLKRGMVLVLSLWDDELTEMDWLDSATVTKKDPITKPGVKRGPCSRKAGDPEFLRTNYPTAHVEYKNFIVGEIGSTYGSAAMSVKDQAAKPMLDEPPAPAFGPAQFQQPQFAPQQPMPPQFAPQQPMPGQPLPQQPMPQQPMPQQPMPQQPIFPQPMGSVMPQQPQQPQQQPQPNEEPVEWAPGGWEDPATLKYETIGGPACCTSVASVSNPCGRCHPGSAVTSGFCVDAQDHCTGSCNGYWCPSGITQITQAFAQPKDLQDLPEVLAPRRPRLTGGSAWLAAPLLLLALPTAAWVWRASTRRHQVEVEAAGFLAEDTEGEPDGGELTAAA